MKKQLLVSVGIPTYNRPEGLKRTLECITKQTYKNLEIIVSDNCSPNLKVKEVVRKFQIKDNRIKYFRQSKNIYGNNFLFVLEKATAEYFMWAADDDSWDSQYIKHCMAGFNRSKKVILVATASRFTDPTGKKPDYIDYGFNTHKLNVVQRFKLFRSIINCRKYTNSIIYGIFKRNVLNTNLLFINVLAWDHLLIAKICLSGEIITVPVIAMLKRRGGASRSFARTAALQKISNPILIKFPFFVREIMMQKIIWKSHQIIFFEKTNISLFSAIKYLDKLIHNIVNQSVDFIKNIIKL